MSNYATAAKPKIGGGIWVAPVGTTLPSNATASLNSAFVSLGYVSEDGLTNSDSPTSESVKAWGGDIIATLNTGVEDTFSFKLVEAMKLDVLKTVFGSSNVSGASLAAGIAIQANAGDRPYYSWVVEMVLKDNVIKRIVIPEAKITEIGEIAYKDGEISGYELTINAIPDSGGNTHYEYLYGASSQVATPVITISTGTATISCATASATIYYTTNGATPTQASAVYESAVSLGTGQTIKAFATKAEMLDSEVAMATRA